MRGSHLHAPKRTRTATHRPVTCEYNGFISVNLRLSVPWKQPSLFKPNQTQMNISSWVEDKRMSQILALTALGVQSDVRHYSLKDKV